MNLKVENVSTSINQIPIIKGVNLEVFSGDFVGIIGPNGSGKSTLLKNIYRLIQPDEGFITLDHKNILSLPNKLLAQNLAVVSQDCPVLFDFTVREIVLMGRSPHKKLLEPDTAADEEIVANALHQVGMEEYIHRSFMSLSGGEKQRVLIARALAQQAKFLVLDEPTNHLDIHHQLQIMDLAKLLNVTVLAALHDLNIAAAYCDRIVVVHSGEIVRSGRPEEVLTQQLLKEVFDVETDIVTHPLTGKTLITYLSDVVRTGTVK